MPITPKANEITNIKNFLFFLWMKKSIHPKMIPIHTNGSVKESAPNTVNMRDATLNLVFLFWGLFSFELPLGGVTGIFSLLTVVGASSDVSATSGIPQLGQVVALSEISFPHSGHVISAMMIPSSLVLFVRYNSGMAYFILSSIRFC